MSSTKWIRGILKFENFDQPPSLHKSKFDQTPILKREVAYEREPPFTKSQAHSLSIVKNKLNSCKKFSENSLSPPYLKGHNDFFDGHRSSPAVPFGPHLTLPLGGGRCEKIAF